MIVRRVNFSLPFQNIWWTEVHHTFRTIKLSVLNHQTDGSFTDLFLYFLSNLVEVFLMSVGHTCPIYVLV